jgi:hypothetical protein
VWRTLPYEEVSLKDSRSPREARQRMTAYVRF